MLKLERHFESALWGSRWIAILGVCVALLLAMMAWLTATWRGIAMASQMIRHLPAASQQTIGSAADLVDVVEAYLLGAFLLVIAVGFYELFLGRLDVARQNRLAGNLLIVGSLDGLKERIAKLVLVMLIVRFGEYGIQLRVASTLDLLALAAGVFLIALSLRLVRGSSEAAGEPR